MASTIVRPRYTEGQVLSASDLEAQVAYGRLDSALHERHEHIWGIANGLDLKIEGESVWVAPGVAIDVSGRRIVVAEKQEIKASAFKNAGVWSAGSPPATKYPLYLQSIDKAQAGGRSAGRCAVEAPTRTEELFQIVFEAPGSERNVNAKQVAIDAGPSVGEKVLLGHVTWDPQLASGSGGFASAGRDSTVRFVGVRASTVIPQNGKLLLQTSEGDPRFVVELSEGAQGTALFRFGRQSGTAPLVPLFTVDEKGDVTVAGKITSDIPQVPVSMSGSSSHGLKLPLPPGIQESWIGEGRVTVDYIISPRIATAKKLFLVANVPQLVDAIPTQVIECSVDRDPTLRTVRCKMRWRKTTAPFSTRVEGGIVDYIVIATPAKANP